MEIKRFRPETDTLLAAGILIIALMLRFWNVASLSFTNDELSAIYRLRFGSLADLINQGIRVDGHPAGIQVFLFFWTKIAGYSELAVRLPFVLLSAFSSIWLYVLGKKWFSAKTGLAAAAAFAILVYPLSLGQIARPYAAGTFFVLSTAWFWTLVLFEKERGWKMLLYALALGLSFSFCLYIHYFAGLFAIICGITGLFFLNRENRTAYITAALLTIIIFSPHISISIGHLKLGGLSNWLGKPEGTWLFEYLFTSLNSSLILAIVALISLIIAFFVRDKKQIFRIISFSWFFASFLIAFIYSRLVNPVLQPSVMLFVFPFLLLLIFSGLEAIPIKSFLFIPLFTLLLSGSTLFERKFYDTYPCANFKGIAGNICRWEKEIGADSLMVIAAINDRWYLDFYMKKCNGSSLPVHTILHHSSEVLPLLLTEELPPYLAYSRLKWTSPHSSSFLRALYPQVIEYFNYGNRSEVMLLSRKDSKPLATYTFQIQESSGLLNLGQGEFSPGIELTRDSVTNASVNTIVFTCKVLSDSISPDDCHLVIHLSYKNKDNDIYESIDIGRFMSENQCRTVFTAISIPDGLEDMVSLKAYIWNPRLKPISAGDFRLLMYE